MREAIGSSLFLNIVLVIIGVISAVLISSIAYSKAFKAKNKIISVIEEYDGKCNFDGYGSDDCTKKIEDVLVDMGYSSNISGDYENLCPKNQNGTNNEESAIIDVKRFYNGDGHIYCVYKYTLCNYTRVTGNRKCSEDSNVNVYYKVKTFMHFDLPIVDSFLQFPVSGETKQFLIYSPSIAN